MPARSRPPAPSPESAPPADLAAPDRIRSTRLLLADTSSALGLIRLAPEQRPQAPRTLSAAELRLARAAIRLLRQQPALAEDAGVSLQALEQALETDLALSRLARAAGELEATAAIGELLLRARLTEHNDRVFLHAHDGDLPPAERDALRTYLASADLIYERQLQLLQARRDRAARRRARQAEELAHSQQEADRLRRWERLLEETWPEP